MYAATDAWVGVVLYNLLLAMPLRVAIKRLPPEDSKSGEEAKQESKVQHDRHKEKISHSSLILSPIRSHS